MSATRPLGALAFLCGCVEGTLAMPTTHPHCLLFQRSMAIKSTSQRRSLLEEPVEPSLAMRCCCRRPKRRPAADALAANKPTTIDDDMPFSTPEEESIRCLPISPLSPWKLSWDLFQLVGG